MLKVSFLSALDNFPLLKHILKIDKYECNTQEIGKEQRQVQCSNRPLHFEKEKS